MEKNNEREYGKSKERTIRFFAINKKRIMKKRLKGQLVYGRREWKNKEWTKYGKSKVRKRLFESWNVKTKKDKKIIITND